MKESQHREEKIITAVSAHVAIHILRRRDSGLSAHAKGT
jgi:hypothetical protein